MFRIMGAKVHGYGTFFYCVDERLYPAERKSRAPS